MSKVSDWEASDNDTPSKPVVPKKGSKWEGEDEEEEAPASDWEDSSEEEEEEKSAPAPVAPPKKKGTLKAKLAEKEALKAAKADESDDYDEDDVLDPREKAQRDKERELKADMHNAADLFGAAAMGGTSSSELDSLISFQPRTKEDFQNFSSQIIELIIKRHQDKPLYPAFIEHHVRELAIPLKDVEVRKAASGLTTLANEKQKEQREKAAGKKKSKANSRPALTGAKPSGRADTYAYEEAMDDFGTNAGDFM